MQLPSRHAFMPEAIKLLRVTRLDAEVHELNELNTFPFHVESEGEHPLAYRRQGIRCQYHKILHEYRTELTNNIFFFFFFFLKKKKKKPVQRSPHTLIHPNNEWHIVLSSCKYIHGKEKKRLTPYH